MFLLIILSSFIFALPSTERTDYYFDGTNYLTDMIGDGLSINGTAIYDGLGSNNAGWAIPNGGVYDSDFPMGQDDFSLFFEGVTMGMEYIMSATNTTFRGKIGFIVYDNGSTLTRADVSLEVPDAIYLGIRTDVNATHWVYDKTTACNLTVIPIDYTINHTIIFNYSVIDKATVYIDGEPCHTWDITGIRRLAIFDYSSQLGGNAHWRVGDIWVSNGDRPKKLDINPPTFSNNKTNATDTTPFFNNILQINITVSDDIDVDTVLLSTNLTGSLINTSKIIFNGASDTFVTTIFNLSINMTRGLMSFQFWANDSSNNISVSQIFTIKIKNSIPTIPIIYSPYNNEINNTRKIIFNSIDNDNDIITYQIYINDTLNITTTTNITVWNGSNNNYNLKINAFDGYGNSGNSSIIYFTLDIGFPIIISILPLEDNSSIYSNDGSINIQLSGTDNRDLTFFELNITRESDNLLKFNITNSSLSGTTFNYITNIDTTSWNNVSFIETVRLCDSHSLAVISKANVIYRKYNELSFDFSGTKIYIKSINGNELYTDTKKLTDRYTTEFYYSKKTSHKVYELTSNKNIKYLPYSKYKGHFVIDNYVWVDFNTNSDVSIEKTDKGYLIYVYNNDDKIIFNSIGLLNCVVEAYSFNLSAIPAPTIPPTLAEVVTNTNTFLLYTLFIFISLTLLFLGFKYEQGIMIFLSCLMGILISISFIRFVDLNPLFQNSVIIFIFINVVIILSMGFGMIKSN